MASITLKNISKSFADNQVIKNVDLEINDGEFVVFVGPSGCGKSTLLRIISGLEDLNEGNILLTVIMLQIKFLMIALFQWYFNPMLYTLI